VAELTSVVLAAGAGTRLRPLTWLRPKALCPVDNVALVDLALRRVEQVTDAVAVNIHHGRVAMEAHLAGRVHLSLEEPDALGTAGALGNLRDWIAGRPTLVVNADAWSDADLGPFVSGWDGERVRLLVAGDGFGPRARVVASLLPWTGVEHLEPRPSGLYERCWRPAQEAGRLDVVTSMTAGRRPGTWPPIWLRRAGVPSSRPTPLWRGRSRHPSCGPALAWRPASAWNGPSAPPTASPCL
jgi:hypothetical protein